MNNPLFKVNKMKKFRVEVTLVMDVELDELKLNDEFNKEFSEYMWNVDCLEDHAEHLAQMGARGLIGLGRWFSYGLVCKLLASSERLYFM